MNLKKMTRNIKVSENRHRQKNPGKARAVWYVEDD